uniref:Uncharacterized protein n=1 Tax=Anguilla anguilla TaxID=7936 RepID=A0A0E9TE49_ANGAN
MGKLDYLYLFYRKAKFRILTSLCGCYISSRIS